MYISCGFDRLYPGGGSFPENSSVASADTPEQHGISFIAELFGSIGYGEPFSPGIFIEDSEASRELWPLYTQLAVKSSVSTILVSIQNAQTYGSVVYAGTGSAAPIVYETQRPNDRAATHGAPPAMLDAAATTTYNDPAMDYLFMASAGSFNYGHFLVDDLPRLKAVEQLRDAGSRKRITIVMVSYGDVIDRVRQQAIRLLAGEGIDLLFLDNAKVYTFAQLLYVTPVSSHPTLKNPLALSHLVQRTAKRIHATPTTKTTGNRLFVARKAGHSRNLLNQPAVIAALEAEGFTTIYPETMGFAEQVNAFRGAEVVVGQMGAAMTNTLFCGVDVKLFYLAPAGWIEPFYWDLAVARGQHYRVLYGQYASTERDPVNRDFTIDVEPLIAAIR